MFQCSRGTCSKFLISVTGEVIITWNLNFVSKKNIPEHFLKQEPGMSTIRSYKAGRI